MCGCTQTLTLDNSDSGPIFDERFEGRKADGCWRTPRMRAFESAEIVRSGQSDVTSQKEIVSLKITLSLEGSMEASREPEVVLDLGNCETSS